MKFLVSRDTALQPLLKMLIIAISVAILLYVVFDGVLHALVIGLDPQSAASTLHGDPESFEEPILLESLLLQVHIDLFMTLLALMILSSVYIRLYARQIRSSFQLQILFLSGLFAPILLLAAYFWGTVMIYGWLGTFVLWHLFAVWMAIRIIIKVRQQ